MKTAKKYAFWIFLSVISGIICGVCGTIFSKSVSFVTDIRCQNEWLLYLLPFGSLLSVCIYKLFHIKNIGTTYVFYCARTEHNLPKCLAPAVFCGTCISHLFGASAGREGAALQIGGSVANTIAHIFKLDEDSRRITIMCGMASLFSAVFGTPIAAWFFVLEIIMTRICISASIPVLISSIMGFSVSQLFNVHPERFNIGELPQFSLLFVGKITLITAASILIAFVFCKGLNLGKSFAKKVFKNEFLRIGAGGILIVALTLLIGSRDYNGGGIDIIERVFDGTVKHEAFALKIIFTIICVSCGYKGGEIIPTLFIGATLGGSLALLLNLPLGVGASIGMAVLFVCATKCPVATILLCGEMFGFSYLSFIAPMVLISFFIARYNGLYGNSIDIFTLIKNIKKA